MEYDQSGWTEEGAFTTLLVDVLKGMETAIGYLKVEDAQASRSDAGYAFISNEVYVRFQTREQQETIRRFGLPFKRRRHVDVMTLESLGSALGAHADIGEPDYSDAGMLQYLRTEHIIPPYQTKGVKVIEMVRIYLASTQKL